MKWKCLGMRNTWKELLCDLVNDLIWEMKAKKKLFEDEYTVCPSLSEQNSKGRESKVGKNNLEGLLMVCVRLSLSWR